MVKVARLYHEHGIRQPEIARRLHVSQARVSRLLKQAELDGIVRTTVVVPAGVQTALEEGLEERYGLREAVVVELLDDSEASITRDLGNATARFLEASLTGGDVVGISSWSSTLLAAVDAREALTSDRFVQEALGAQGAVGDICLRFFDAGGERVESDVDRRVIGVSLEQLRDADRAVGIAGGPRKYEAILGALRGGWINVLITDSTTAERLLAEPTT